MSATATGRDAPIVRQHDHWTLTICDDLPIQSGTYAPSRSVHLEHDGVRVLSTICPAYKVWTVLAHWTENLPEPPPATTPTPVEPVDLMWSELFEEVRHSITYKPGYRILLRPDGRDHDHGRWYYQIEADRVDAITGEQGVGRGGKAYLSPEATRSELVQTVFGLLKAFEEHECREFFRYDGQQVFGPHFDVLALHEIATAGRTEYRS